jgi:hypothetical protein
VTAGPGRAVPAGGSHAAAVPVTRAMSSADARVRSSSARYLGIARGAQDEARLGRRPRERHVRGRLLQRREAATPPAVRQLGEMEARLRVAWWALLAAVDEIGDDPRPTTTRSPR